jgi:hypothetical protein
MVAAARAVQEAILATRGAAAAVQKRGLHRSVRGETVIPLRAAASDANLKL